MGRRGKGIGLAAVVYLRSVRMGWLLLRRALCRVGSVRCFMGFARFGEGECEGGGWEVEAALIADGDHEEVVNAGVDEGRHGFGW